jgi:hypothetical protein
MKLLEHSLESRERRQVEESWHQIQSTNTHAEQFVNTRQGSVRIWTQSRDGGDVGKYCRLRLHLHVAGSQPIPLSHSSPGSSRRFPQTCRNFESVLKKIDSLYFLKKSVVRGWQLSDIGLVGSYLGAHWQFLHWSPPSHCSPGSMRILPHKTTI